MHEPLARRHVWIPALLLLLSAAAAAVARAADHVTIWLDKTDRSVHVAYHFAPGTLLTFAGEATWQSTVRETRWKLDADCFKLEGNGIGRVPGSGVRTEA